MNFETITFNVDAGIARLTLNRPDKLNSFTGEMHGELRVALDQVQTDTSIRVLVLTGAGRGFSAGQDLGDRAMQIQAGKMPDIGSTNVQASVEDKRPIHATLDYNNYGFNNISRNRFGAGIEVGNALREGAILTFNGIVGDHP